MTEKDFNAKWLNRLIDDMTDEEFQEFKDNSFSMYEETGFIDRFDSPYDDEGEHNGMTFKVIRRATAEEVDIEVMPMWLVEFENGDTAYCYPEEICKAEH